MMLFFSFAINVFIVIEYLTLFSKFLEDKDQILLATLFFLHNIYLPMSDIEKNSK